MICPPERKSSRNQKFDLLVANPRHPSLDFMPLRANVWRARVGDHYRALARKSGESFEWFWIGTHEEYNNLVTRL